VLAALIAPLLALAAGEPPIAREAGPAVEIAIASSTPEPATRVRVDLEELLGRQGLDARYRLLSAVDRDEVLRPASLAPCSLACIWIDLGVARAGHALVYVSATAAEQVVIRALRLPNGLDEVAREEVSHIVASSVEALQAGRPLPLAPEPDAALYKAPPPPPPPTPPLPAAPPSRRWIAAGLAAGAARESSGVLAAPTVGLSVVVGAKDARWSPALWLAAAGFSSDANETAAAPVALRFRGGELAALAAVGSGPGGRFAARLGLGGGLELRQATPAISDAAAADGVALSGSRLDPAVFVRAAARLEVPLFAPIGLFVVASCDARVVNARYVVDSDGTTEIVYMPSRFRPQLLAGVEATFGQGGSP
jgi:hypothetical protein